jgi:putative hydrolase of the HAD superfamily
MHTLRGAAGNQTAPGPVTCLGTMPTIRAVLLDADGVVQLPGSAWGGSLGLLCGDPSREDEFRTDVFDAEKPCLTGVADFEAALAQVLRKWQSTVSVEVALRVWSDIEPATDILDLVHSLRSRGMFVSLATNQQAHRANFMTDSLGYRAYFDHLLYSCELGFSKPSVEYFSCALAKIAIEPSEVLFIDDHEANVSAARNCGLHGEVFHLSEGVGPMREILKEYGLDVSE